MLTRITLFCLWCIALVTLIAYACQNHGIPLWFDHGAYSHLIQILAANGNIETMPTYIQSQFEPFSGIFFYTITRWIPESLLFSFWYIGIYALTSVALFLLGKKHGKYTLWSYLGLFLFIFSVSQYVNFWWSFGKQMFATFFLILLMRYHTKSIITVIFLAACIALHRLTGFIAILFIVFSFFQKKAPPKWPLFIAVWAALITYLPTFQIQVLPFLTGKIQNYIFLSKGYGTWLNGITLWMYEIPILLLLCSIASVIKKKNILRSPYSWLLLFTFLMLIFRWIAHTRIGTFFDLSVIIFLTVYWASLRKNIFILFLIIQMWLWFSFWAKWHSSYIDQEEKKIMHNLIQTVPENIKIVTLTSSYTSMLIWYSKKEIYSPEFGIGRSVFHGSDLQKMRIDEEILCKNLWLLSWEVILYVGAKERSKSTTHARCLHEIIRWDNKARLLYFDWPR